MTIETNNVAELVEQLRFGKDVESWWVLGSEAADEIERLRSESQSLSDRIDVLAKRYDELLFAVSKKYEGEDRHETALRYIREREADCGTESRASLTQEEGRMSKLTELAERCEKATGPDRELDAAIGSTIYQIKVDREVFGIEGCYHELFTASLDAAMTLVPDGVRLAGLSQKMDGSGWYVHLMHRGSREHFEARGDTCPLTLCAAALKARTKNTPDSQKDG